jgi:acetolactate synthase-1/2/3 large subunit
MTGIANAHVARASVLVLSGVPPRPQENRGALQDMAHIDLRPSATRYARTVREPSLILQELDEGVRARPRPRRRAGAGFLDFPVDVLRAEVPAALRLPEHLRAARAAALLPDPDACSARSRCSGRRSGRSSSPAAALARGARAGAPARAR